MMAPTTKSKAIEIRSASLQFGNKTVLDDISLDFYQGELTALLGPNGTGKSTLLKVITQDIKHCNHPSFALSILGKKIKQWPPEELAKHMGMLPQSSSLTFNFTVREVVELGGIPLDIPQKKLHDVVKLMMNKTGVDDLADYQYPNLSGGEKQRVHFARVLTQLSQSGSRQIVLLDEPTSALDIEYQHKILGLAKALTNVGVSVVLVIHDLNLAAQYADRIVMLNKGKVVADGSPWQVLTEKNVFEVYKHKVTVVKHPELDVPLIV